MAHKHTCIDCGAVIAEGDFDCEFDTDHGFAKCDKCASVKWEIQTRSAHPGALWSSDAVGDANEFDSQEEAWSMVEELKRLGDDWANADYRVMNSAEPVC